ncbi:hypothetical protein NIES4072_67430 [Nostoc commune NIES-4072]|uniref:Tryptophan 2,3-dioxygenase n=1 Tax=Nostoc commune NIES-4072 TaxID=2005467 RepID=A0A2R5G4R0_NOSCO|nr:hypothetical protein NIES4070_67880 [Nostoc commune HK-02]GBG23031.1 hypothetical protein NIES4072_67430 [Nostoc commune NIES-4072]
MSELYTFQPLPLINPSLDISENHYWNYHNIKELISCKKPLTASVDEDLFIAVHQMCELAFHQMIIDMERVLKTLAQALQDGTDPIIGNTAEVCYFFRRILRLYEVVNTIFNQHILHHFLLTMVFLVASPFQLLILH